MPQKGTHDIYIVQAGRRVSGQAGNLDPRREGESRPQRSET